MEKEKSNGDKDSKNQIPWTLHETNPELVDMVRSKLSEVIDPELGFNIVELGLVRDFSVENGVGTLKMILTTPFCPYGPEMVAMTKAKAEEALKGLVNVEMLPEIWDPTMMEDPSLMGWGLY